MTQGPPRADLVCDVTMGPLVFDAVAAATGCGLVFLADGPAAANSWQVVYSSQFATWNISRRVNGAAPAFVTNTGLANPNGPVRVLTDPVAGTVTVWVPGPPAPTVVSTFPDDVRAAGRRWVGMTTSVGAAPRAGFASFTVAPDPDPPTTPTPQFTGRLFSASHEAGVTTFEAADGLADLAAYNGPEQAAGPVQATGDRITRILTEAGYRGPVRLDHGTEQLQGQTLAQAALTELWHAVDSELGAVWVDRAGVLVFRDRNVWTQPPVWLEQLGPDDACGILTATEQHLSAEHVRTIVYAASGGHTQEQAIDVDAVNRFGPRRWGRNDLLLRGQANLRAWADEVLLWSKDPRPGAITQLVLNPATRPRLWPVVLRLDPMVCWRLSFDHDLAETPVVVGYAHSVTATSWQVTVVLAPHPLDAIEGHPFTLDDPTAGKLDAGNVLT
jgi:hypothetical protein